MLRNSLNVCQSGFRKNHSTVTTLLDVQDFILNNTNNLIGLFHCSFVP